MNDLEAFAKLAQALAPWHGQLVFIGGWAHRLHRFDPRANELDYQPVFTLDTDLAFANTSSIAGNINNALLEHGFTEELTGEYKPPVAHYTLGNESGGFYAEFLTPLTGSGFTRSREKDATMAVAGISAQKIRHLDILLVNPWISRLNCQTFMSLPSPMDVQVANPLCFMVQKFLIQKNRSPEKQSQDILYIYDTIELFGALLHEFNQKWHTVISPALGENLSNTILTSSKDTFSKVNDRIRDATRIPQDRQVLPAQIQETCQYAFKQIFAEI